MTTWPAHHFLLVNPKTLTKFFGDYLIYVERTGISLATGELDEFGSKQYDKHYWTERQLFDYFQNNQTIDIMLSCRMPSLIDSVECVINLSPPLYCMYIMWEDFRESRQLSCKQQDELPGKLLEMAYCLQAGYYFDFLSEFEELTGMVMCENELDLDFALFNHGVSDHFMSDSLWVNPDFGGRLSKRWPLFKGYESKLGYSLYRFKVSRAT